MLAAIRLGRTFAPSADPSRAGLPGVCAAGRRLLLGLLLLGTAACGDDGSSVALVGTVERTQIELTAPLSETLIAVEVVRGQHVTAGDVVVRLDPILARVEVARAEALLAGARTGDRVAALDLTRLRRLSRNRVASAQDLERAELARDEAGARLREAEAVLDAANKRLGDLTLAAPADAVVDQLPFEAGERVPAGAVVAVLLADGAPWVRVWVPEQGYARVAPGTDAEIAVDGIPGLLRGRVLDVAREPEFTPHYALTERDRVHLVFEARVEILDAPGHLRPGIPAQVRLLPGASLYSERPGAAR